MKATFCYFAAAAIVALTACNSGPKIGGVAATVQISQEEMETGFVNPPASAKPHTWWHWMDGNVTKEGITADLEAMAEAGLGGVQIFNAAGGIPHGGVMFNSPEWIEMVRFASEEAARLGLEVCLHNCGGWSSSGGPWNTPENSMKIVVMSELQVNAGEKVQQMPPQPKTNKDFYRDIAVLAFPTPEKDSANLAIEQLNSKIFLNRGMVTYAEPTELPEAMTLNPDKIIDITALLSGDNPSGWEVPADASYTVLRIGYTSNGRNNHPATDEGTGLECDKLSRSALKAHWDGHVAKVLDAIGAANINGKTGLNNALIDSYEVGTQNWTQGFEKEFEKRTGYSLIKYLPVLNGVVVGSAEITDRFLWDFRRVIADMFAENYSEYFGELAHAAGLLYSSEPYGNGPSDDIQYGSYCDIPMGEFWQNSGHSVDIGNSKLPASIAHVYGKKFVGAEAFTAAPDGGKWLKDAYAIKAQGDAAYCGGINRMIYHRYAHQPWVEPTRYPGMTMGQWGTHFERTLTWWSQAKDWLLYQARCQFMLQEGLFVADVLFYSGEGAPNELRNAALPAGYDYDGCDTKALKLLKVKNGKLTLPSGMTYRMLVLPKDASITPETLKVIERLADAGATIVAQQKPVRSPGLKNYTADRERSLKADIDRVWAKLITDKSPEEAVKDLISPDFSANDESAALKYIHRNIDGADVYFICTPTLKGCEEECTFRVSGKAPELWHPESGTMEMAAVYEEKDGLTTVPLRFDPSGSVFVVFRKPAPEEHLVALDFVAEPDKTARIPDLKIIKADYGFFNDVDFDKCFDVTDRVQKGVAEGKTEFRASNGEMGGDPCFGTIKNLRIVYTASGEKKIDEVKEDQRIILPAGAKVLRAYYGVTANVPDVEPVRQLTDITPALAALVKNGLLNVKVGKDLNGGKDAAPGLPKQLRVDYSVDGVKASARIAENGRLVLPPVPEDAIAVPEWDVAVAADGAVSFGAWRAGTFTAVWKSGKEESKQVAEVAKPMVIGGSWQLSFPAGWGAPEKVSLDKLISWTEHSNEGVRYFSGTAVYDKTFEWDAPANASQRLILDLGSLKNFAEVTLNGKSLPLLWKPPYRLDVTDVLKQGENAMQLRITNLWPNRLIGDEQTPDDLEWKGISLKEIPQWVKDGKPSPTGRYTFTTWRHWRKDSALLPSGLFGPVLVRTVQIEN
jgi:hypothetical protein